MVMGVHAGKVAGSDFSTCSGNVPVGPVELACVALTLVLARGDGLGVGGVRMLILVRVALSGSERRNSHQRGGQGDRFQFRHVTSALLLHFKNAHATRRVVLL
jgi:hypothetical protein